MNLTASGSLISVGWDDTIAFTGGALNAIGKVHSSYSFKIDFLCSTVYIVSKQVFW